MPKVALITGCSTGFGREIASAFVARGDRVIATVRSASAVPELREALAAAGDGEVDVQQLDVTDARSRGALAAHVHRTHGALDVLVNNAGISVVGALEAVSEEDCRAVFETNFFGAIAVTTAFLPVMRERGSGRIVFLSAVGALLNTPYMGVYTASKHAVDSLAAAWDIELRPFGIRVVSILPSAFNTAMAGNIRVVDDDPAYTSATHRYVEGLRSRIRNGPVDLSPVSAAVLHAVDDADPPPRFLVGGGMAVTLAPLVESLAQLHDQQLATTAALWN